VTVYPARLSIEATHTVNFTTSVSGVGKENFRYQWRYNGVDINGETSNTLNIYSVTKDDSGTYECEVRNEYGCGCTSKTCALSEKR